MGEATKLLGKNKSEINKLEKIMLNIFGYRLWAAGEELQHQQESRCTTSYVFYPSGAHHF